jgi:hypothetical protein
MRKALLLLAACSLLIAGFRPIWGFFAHERINRLAVFSLPPQMIGFYKKNIDYLTRTAVNPDKRRYAVPEEAPRHYLDVDHYGDSALKVLPLRWKDAVNKFGEDTLQAYGILPWHVYAMYHRLREAMAVKDPALILRLSAELGHYIGDAHVPLHTTENYNGQLTGQEGIHGFWESRLPEIFSEEYDFMVGPAEYIADPLTAAWEVIAVSHSFVERVLAEEKKLARRYAEKKWAFETRGKTSVKVYAVEYAREYHKLLEGMVEKQMRASIKMTADFWYTAWVDAGQPDLKKLIDHKPNEDELRREREALEQWKVNKLQVREP